MLLGIFETPNWWIMKRTSNFVVGANVQWSNEGLLLDWLWFAMSFTMNHKVVTGLWSDRLKRISGWRVIHRFIIDSGSTMEGSLLTYPFVYHRVTVTVPDLIFKLLWMAASTRNDNGFTFLLTKDISICFEYFAIINQTENCPM